MEDLNLAPPPSKLEWFASTHWSVVLAAKSGDSSAASEALEKLCRTYWPPLFAFIRRAGYDDSEAKDGVDDTVQVAHEATLNAFPLTIAGWVKTAQNSPGYVAVLNKYPSGAGNGYSLHIHNGRLAAFYFRGDGVSHVYAGDPGLDGGFIADGRWHHVAFVVDANGGRLHVDGTRTGSLGWTGTPGPCTTPVAIFIGPYPSGGQNLSLDGRIDELTLWNRALDATEINAVMNFKQTGTESGLIGFWPFDNGSGTTATDATGHGHNGVSQNGPLWVPSDALVSP